MRLSFVFTTALFFLAAQIAGAQEVWSGVWMDSGGLQGGRLEFVLTSDGMIEGNITNGDMIGLWSGFIRDDGVMFVDYQYPTAGFAAQAVGSFTQQQGDVFVGRMAFVQNNQVFAEGDFRLTRSFTSPQQVDPGGYEYPFTGNGLYVYCAAPSVCGQRGANTLPGNWGWTSGLFDDLERYYPQVYCNLYVNACSGP